MILATSYSQRHDSVVKKYIDSNQCSRRRPANTESMYLILSSCTCSVTSGKCINHASINASAITAIIGPALVSYTVSIITPAPCTICHSTFIQASSTSLNPQFSSINTIAVTAATSNLSRHIGLGSGSTSAIHATKSSNSIEPIDIILEAAEYHEYYLWAACGTKQHSHCFCSTYPFHFDRQ